MAWGLRLTVVRGAASRPSAVGPGVAEAALAALSPSVESKADAAPADEPPDELPCAGVAVAVA